MDSPVAIAVLTLLGVLSLLGAMWFIATQAAKMVYREESRRDALDMAKNIQAINPQGKRERLNGEPVTDSEGNIIGAPPEVNEALKGLRERSDVGRGLWGSSRGRRVAAGE